MGKPSQHVGTSADDLRQATREANAQMKDLQAVIREARAANGELRASADSYAKMVTVATEEAITQSMARFAEVIEKEGKRGVAEVRGEIRVAVESLAERMLDAASNISPEMLDALELFRGPLSRELEQELASASGLTVKPIMGMHLDTAETDWGKAQAARGIDMTINGTDITVCQPVETTGLSDAAIARLLPPGKGDLAMPCPTCSRQVWVPPLKLKAMAEGADLICMSCAGSMLRIVREAGAQNMAIMHGEAVITSRSKPERRIRPGVMGDAT
jgi:hypothetical protein